MITTIAMPVVIGECRVAGVRSADIVVDDLVVVGTKLGLRRYCKPDPYVVCTADDIALTHVVTTNRRAGNARADPDIGLVRQST